MRRILIAIPTYNEIENAPLIISKIEEFVPGLDLLFVDDNSPDGTGKLLDSLKNEKTNLNVIHRPGKNGIGSAHQAAIAYAYKNKYDFLITMDCDFSHPPEFLSELIKHSQDFDIVLGSRYLRDDSIGDWNIFRKSLTYLGHFLTKTLLGMNYDASNAFRIYSLHRIPKEIFSLVKSLSYSFFFESLFIMSYNKFRIKEIPMMIPKRTYGHSKMTFSDIYKSLKLLSQIFFRRILNRKSLQYERK